ncbi:MAG: hypothetical protein EXR52_04690 [Dehalococcoidia bacterium]|nr:hypothetical protein [Dehalococcoidia bacterium]
MALGPLIIGHIAKLWPGGPTAVNLHEFTTLTALVMATIAYAHPARDTYIAFSPLTLPVSVLYAPW